MQLPQKYETNVGEKGNIFSGGEKQRISIIRALLRKSKILLLDEISNGVDPLARKNLYAYLHSLKETITFMITHRIDEAEKICDKIAIIVSGKIKCIESP